jgi:PAS domain S-box-containing protein
MLEENFAFASPRGTITRWGAGAAVLFGMSGEEVAGRSLFEAVLVGDDGGWANLLEGKAKSARRMVALEFARADGQTFPCEVRFLPVVLADGLEFSSFSADLRAERPREESEELLRSRHPHVVELLEKADDGDESLDPDAPLAGLVVTFRSSAPPPAAADKRLEDALERTEREVEDIREPVTRLETQVDGLAAQIEQAFRAMAELRSDIELALTAGQDARQLAVDAQRDAGTTRRVLAALGTTGVNPNGDPDGPARPPRPGFDDAGVPMATLTLQGNFMELNPGFRELVGYTEEEFASARWPSNVDRARLEEHTELREKLAAGEIEGEHVDVAYMHSAGLVVELSGRMSLVRTSNAVPDHLLLTLDVR